MGNQGRRNNLEREAYSEVLLYEGVLGYMFLWVGFGGFRRFGESFEDN